METTVKYSLNPLASCFVPLSMKVHPGIIIGDLYSNEFKNPVCSVHRSKGGVLPNRRNKKLNDYRITKRGGTRLDTVQKEIAFEELCLTRKEYLAVPETVHNIEEEPDKLNGNEVSTGRSENGSLNENEILRESVHARIWNAVLNMNSVELEQTENTIKDQIMDFMESERTEKRNKDQIMDFMESERTEKRNKDQIMDFMESERTAKRNKDQIMDFMESERTGNKDQIMELKRTGNKDQIMDFMELERTGNKDQIMDLIESKGTENLIMDHVDSEGTENMTVTRSMDYVDSVEFEPIDKSTCVIDPVETKRLNRTVTQITESDGNKNMTSTKRMDSIESEGIDNVASTASTGSMESDENESMSSMELDISPVKKGFNWLDKNLYYRMNSNCTLSLYLTILLSSILSSENEFSKNESRSKSVVKAENSSDKIEKECQCPSMFGWIVPLEYFGNPLGLIETCSKKYVHTTYESCDYKSYVHRPYFNRFDEMEKHSTDSHFFDEPSDLIDKAFTLEQCSWELEAIIKDVCDSVDKSLLSCNDGEILNQNDDSKTTNKYPTWQTPSRMESLELTIVDDGHHPLLQDIPSVDEDDKEISLIEKFLGEALTFGERSLNEEKLTEHSSCIPPCSVWCNNVPPPAKDTYRRFIKKLDSKSIHLGMSDENKGVLKKHAYKRCFSADDTPKSFTFDKTLSNLASSFESKEQSWLLRKDPVTFKDFKRVAPVDSNRKSRSSNFIFEQVTTFTNEKGSDTWSLYDNADSKWQPLPECVPSNDNAQKYFHKKGRDMKRQKSVG